MDIVDGLRLVAGAPTDRLDCFNCHSRMREAADEITRLRAELAECKAELEFFRTVLYSGWTVYEELRREPKHGARTSPDNVGDTLDAIARLRKAALAAKGE